MNSRITYQECYDIINKLDVYLSNDFHRVVQNEKKFSKLKKEIFAHLMVYIGKICFREISKEEELLYEKNDELTYQLYVHFTIAIVYYYEDVSKDEIRSIDQIVKETEIYYSKEKLADYLSTYCPDVSCFFINVANDLLNTNPLEINNFLSGNYKQMEDLNLDFNHDIKTIINSNGYYQNAILENLCLPHVFSSYAIFCLKRIHDHSPLLSANMISEISNDIWNCVVAELPDYSNFKSEYFERLDEEIFDIHAINHAISLMKVNDIECSVNS